MTNAYARGLATFKALTRDAVRKNLSPPPKLSLSQWANTYAVLSRETSADTGRFRSFRYQDGMMDAVTDPTVETITVIKAARVGYTKMLDHTVGYFLHQDPSPILVVQPRVEDAEGYSSTEIEPMLRDTPALAELTGDLKAKDSKQTLLSRSFRNGASIKFVGANSPGGFRRITCRVVLFDEVDGYPKAGAGDEGDQIALGKKRAETFWNSKIILGSTPTTKGESRIEKSFEESDQRRYWVPCPHCGEYQVLEWGGPDSAHGLKWDCDEDGNGLYETAYYVCKHNGCIFHDADKFEMIERGEWRASKPFKGHAGFHIWSAYSLFPKAAWPLLVKEWLSVKDDPLTRKTFVNTVLGETYEDVGERPLNESELAARAEVYPYPVPNGVGVVVAGIDVQDYRVEVELVGWGAAEESWSVDYIVLDGEFSDPLVRAQLDEVLQSVYEGANGQRFHVSAACIDSGGHHTQAVYAWSKQNIGRRCYAIKGESARNGQRSPVWPTKRPSKKNKSSFRPIIIGVNSAKDVIRQRLHIKEPGPGYMHFPVGRGEGYYAQLTSEKSLPKTVAGQTFRVWVLPNGRANEASDCRVYAYAALCGLNHMGLKLDRAAAAKTAPAPTEPAAGEPASAPAAAAEPTPFAQLHKRVTEQLNAPAAPALAPPPVPAPPAAAPPPAKPATVATPAKRDWKTLIAKMAH